MQEPNLNRKIQGTLDNFVSGLKNIYNDNLVSIILYGSAASGEFIDKHSNLNILIILKNADLENLMAASRFINKWRFRTIRPLFFNEEYIKTSNDVFPIEFLDIKENYNVLLGKDILKDISINTNNLRFQCEHELKAKLISLRQVYLRRNKDKKILLNSLFRHFTSVMHILRNVLRLKGKPPVYLKQDILKEISAEFQIDSGSWDKLLAAKNKQIKLRIDEVRLLFVTFLRDLENLIDLVDKL